MGASASRNAGEYRYALSWPTDPGAYGAEIGTAQ